MTHPAHGELPEPRQQQPAGAGPKTMTDLLTLADPERNLMIWLVRQRGASMADIVAQAQLHNFGIEANALQGLLDDLIAAGFLSVDTAAEPAVFKPNLISRQSRTVPDELWKAID